jgi:CubicO group peptidase (beta-lactamase class C family)
MTDHSPTRDYWPTTGWRSAAPEDQGVDSSLLAEAQTYLAERVPHMNSFLVVRGGYLVWEHYSGGTGPDSLRNVKSVTKSVLSTLIGIARQTGDIPSLDDTLGDFFPEYFTAASDGRKRAITVHDLLTMRSGLDWAEYGPSVVEMTASKNWIKFALDKPLARDPGTHHNYSTGDTQLLSGVLQRAAGLSALEFADLYLFGPLGIERRTWPADPQGITIGGAELSLRARDMAKIGYLILNQGGWDGEQIVPADWVQAATSLQVLVIPDGARDCPEVGYGYLWWLRPQGEHASALAVGFGGQYIYVIPALDLVVVLTGDITSAPAPFRDNQMLCQFNLVEDLIVPAVGTSYNQA